MEIKKINGYGLKDEVARNEIDNINKEIESIIVTYDIIVSQDGKGDYTTLSEAVNNATDGQSIYVKQGVYENESVNCVGKKLTIIGENVETTIIQNSYDDYDRPPLNIGKGLIKNLSFKQNGATETNGRSYAVHIDNNDLYQNTLLFENCNFYSYSNASVGVGTRNNCELIFKDCIFISDNNDETNKVGALFIHNAVNSQYYGVSQYVTIDNCEIISKHQCALHLRYCGPSSNLVFIKSYNSVYKSLNDKIFVFEGVVTYDSYEGATKNIYIDNSSHGNNIEIMNAGKYNGGNKNLIGLFNSDTINDSIKRYVGTANINIGTNNISLPFKIETPVNVSMHLLVNGYWFPALIHSSDGVNVITYVFTSGGALQIDSTIGGTIVYIIDYV